MNFIPKHCNFLWGLCLELYCITKKPLSHTLLNLCCLIRGLCSFSLFWASFHSLPPGIRRKAATKHKAEWAGHSGHLATVTLPQSLVACSVYFFQKSSDRPLLGSFLPHKTTTKLRTKQPERRWWDKRRKEWCLTRPFWKWCGVNKGTAKTCINENWVRLWVLWLIARLGVSGLPSSAQIVTCTSGQTQTTMTKSGSDIILYGLAGKDDGIIIGMASLCRDKPRLG